MRIRFLSAKLELILKRNNNALNIKINLVKVIKKVKEEISKSFKLSWPLSKLQRGCCQKEREGGTENLEEIFIPRNLQDF